MGEGCRERERERGEDAKKREKTGERKKRWRELEVEEEGWQAVVVTVAREGFFGEGTACTLFLVAHLG